MFLGFFGELHCILSHEGLLHVIEEMDENLDARELKPAPLKESVLVRSTTYFSFEPSISTESSSII